MTDSTVAVTATDVLERGVQRTVLPNGLTVLSEHMPGVRSVSFGAWVCAASLHEPREKMGVSHLLEHMVFKGPAPRSAQDIALSLESVSARMYRAAGVELYGEPYRTLDEVLALVDAITPDQIQDAAREYFAPERMTVVSLGPKPVTG